MVENVDIKPMTEDFILWRCLHGGPLTRDTIDQWSSADLLPWQHYRERNIPLLEKITRTYGACAFIAHDNDEIVGQLRFYPRVICDLDDAGGLCLQQDFPAGPSDGFIYTDFPGPAQIKDKTLVVHCLMTGSPQQKENPYQRKGIGTHMVKALIEWSKTNGWKRIEAESFEDIPIIYEITGNAGHTFWEKLGFRLIDRHPHPELLNRREYAEFVTTLEEQAEVIGILPERARDRLLMRLDVV